MPTRGAGRRRLIVACRTLVPNAQSQAARPGNRSRLLESTTKGGDGGRSGRLAKDSALHRSDSSSSTPPAQHFVLGSQLRLQQSTGARCPTLKGVRTGLLVRATAGARVGAVTFIMPARGPGHRAPLRVNSLLIVISAFPLRNVAHRLRRKSDGTTTVRVLLSQSRAKTPAPATLPVPTERLGARASSRTPRQSSSTRYDAAGFGRPSIWIITHRLNGEAPMVTLVRGQKNVRGTSRSVRGPIVTANVEHP